MNELSRIRGSERYGACDDEELDRTIEALRWWNRLQETNNRSFLPLFWDTTHRYLVLKGGGGSGKSIFAGRFVLERVTSEPGTRWLVCRKVAKTLRESCFNQLIGQHYDRDGNEFYPGCGMKVNKSDMTLSYANGSVIIFAGLDDVEKLKSIYDIEGIWIEEASELSAGDFNQLDIRLRGESQYIKQIVITFNPVSIHHWLKERFFDNRDERARVHESTYHDNRFLDAENIQTLEAFRDTDPYHYMVYCLGQWGVTGKSVFDNAAIQRRLEQRIKPLRVGYFEYDYDGLKITNICWTEDATDGFIKLYRDPEEGAPYVLGGDTAGDGSDQFVGQVLDNRSGTQAAVLRRGFDEDVYARQMYCLGLHYNAALIGIETNYSTYPVKELSRLRYPKQYVREREDTFTGKLKKSFGFETTAKTRPIIISGLIQAARECVRERGSLEIVSDENTLLEMQTFVRNEAFRPEAEAGAHDDTVMALAIAHYIRPQQRYTAQARAGRRAKWTKDMWEDYRNADEDGKRTLLEKWGNPG